MAYPELSELTDGEAPNVSSEKLYLSLPIFRIAAKPLHKLCLSVSLDTCDADDFSAISVEGYIVQTKLSQRVAGRKILNLNDAFSLYGRWLFLMEDNIATDH